MEKAKIETSWWLRRPGVPTPTASATSPLDDVDKATNRVTGEIVDAAIAVHRALGTGLLEGAYEVCLRAELEARGLKVRRQVPIGLRYRDVSVEVAFRVDLIVEERVVVELKTIAQLTQSDSAQLATYLRFTRLEVGLLLNFHAAWMKDGIRRIVRTHAPDDDAAPLPSPLCDDGHVQRGADALVSAECESSTKPI